MPSEISTLSYFSIFVRLIHTKYYLEKPVDKVYYLLQKTDLIVVIIKWDFNGFINGKS